MLLVYLAVGAEGFWLAGREGGREGGKVHKGHLTELTSAVYNRGSILLGSSDDSCRMHSELSLQRMGDQEARSFVYSPLQLIESCSWDSELLLISGSPLCKQNEERWSDTAGAWVGVAGKLAA